MMAGERAAIDALANGEVAAWQALLEHLLEKKPEAAPRAFVEAALVREAGFDGWVERARRAAGQCQSERFTTTLSATRAFVPWLAAGIRAARPATDAACLEARLALLTQLLPARPGAERPTDAEAFAAAQALLQDARPIWGGGPMLAQLLILVHRRAGEAAAHDAAMAAITEAEALYRALGDDDGLRAAQRQRAATLLRLGHVEEGLELLDGLLDTPGPLFGGGGAFSFGGGAPTPEERARDEAATIAAWATATTPEWVRAIGGMAERASDAARREGLWGRFERALDAMLTASDFPEEDLEVVVRQAREREFRETARRAIEIARRRQLR